MDHSHSLVSSPYHHAPTNTNTTPLLPPLTIQVTHPLGTTSTTVHSTSLTYPLLSLQITELLYERSRLFELLRAIHPAICSSYRLLFGGKYCWVVRPAGYEAEGCLDVNVVLMRREENGNAMCILPNECILPTLSIHYSGVETRLPAMELQMAFYRVKPHLGVGPFATDESLTTLISVEESTVDRGYAYSKMVQYKDRDEEDWEVTEEAWITEFDHGELEVEVWKILNGHAATAAAAVVDSVKNGKGKKKVPPIKAKGTQAKVVPAGKKKAVQKEQVNKSTAPTKKLKDNSNIDSNKSKPVTPLLDAIEAAKALAAANPKPKLDARAMAEIASIAASTKEGKTNKSSSSSAAAISQDVDTDMTAKQSNKKDTEKVKKQRKSNKSTMESEETTPQSNEGDLQDKAHKAKSPAGTKANPKSPASTKAKPKSPIKSKTDSNKTKNYSSNKNNKARNDSRASLALQEEARALAQSNPKERADAATAAKILSKNDDDKTKSKENDAKGESEIATDGNKSKSVKKKNAGAVTVEAEEKQSTKKSKKDTNNKKDADKQSTGKKSKKDESNKKDDLEKQQSTAKKAKKDGSSTRDGSDKQITAKKAKNDENAKQSTKKDEQKTNKAAVHAPSPQKESSEPAQGLSKGWTQCKVPRPNGKGSDTYYFSPYMNIRCRSKPEAKKLIAKMEEIGGDETAAWTMVKEDEKMEKKKKKRKASSEVVDGNDGESKRKKSKLGKKREKEQGAE